MNKLGVRLVAVYFFVWAILSTVGLLLSPSDAGGFFGIRFGGSSSYDLPFIGSGTFQLDCMALGKIFFLFWVGYSILRFQSSARVAALIVLWPPVIIHSIIPLMILFGAIYTLFFGTYSAGDSHATFSFFHTNWPGTITDPVLICLIFIGEFLLRLVPTYFLMRKDVKQLFEKPVAAGETN